MKSISAFALFVAATFIAAGSASAQAGEKATIPFNFTVGNHTLPAGTYTLRPSSSSPELIVLSNTNNSTDHLMTVGRPDQNNPKHVDNLEFHRYGGQYFLSEIRSSDSSMNIHFATTKAEKSARSQTEEAQQQVNDPVLIALK